MQNKSNALENEKLLRSYQDKLVETYDVQLNGAIGAFTKGRQGTSDDGFNLGNYLEYTSSFGALLCELSRAAEQEKIRLDNITGSLETSEDEINVDFGYLLVSLSRTIPLVDEIVKRICDLNIGDSVITGDNSISAMHSALVWLYLQSSDYRDLAYQDMERLRRFLKYQIVRYKYNNDLVYTANAIKRRHDEVCDVLWCSDRDRRIQWLKEYRTNVKQLLHDTFSCFEDLHAYYDYMKRVDRKAFESNMDAKRLSSEYTKIYILASNVQNIILRRFSSFVKIGNLNAPHGSYSHADFVSSTLSESNFTNSDFKHCDFTNAVLRNCDMSVSDMSFITAVSTDFSGSNLNATNLIGADFSNATLSGVQMMSALFRDGTIDRDITYYERAYLSKNSKKHKHVYDFLEKRSRFGWSSMEESYASPAILAAGLRNDFFIKLAKGQQDFARGRFTEEWRATTVQQGDTSVKVMGSIDAVTKIFSAKASNLFSAMELKVLPPEVLYTIDEIVENESMEEKSRKHQRYGIPASPKTAKFADATMSNASLPHVDLCHVDLSSVSLCDADVNDSDLFYTKLNNAAMNKTNFSESRFLCSTLLGGNLSQANLMAALIMDCDMSGANFSNALLLRAMIVRRSSTPFINDIFEENATGIVDRVKDINLEYNQAINDCNFNQITGSELIIVGMNADRSTWISAELKKAIFFNTVARWAQFDKADFSYALLIGVSLHQASFTETIMSNARLFSCDMSGTRLHKVNFIATRLDKVIFQNADLSNTNFSRSFVKNCVFSDVNFAGANISDAVFENVVFENIDFGNCVGLSTAKFQHCYFGDGCTKLQYQIGADGKPDKDYMSIAHHGSRVKFFRDENQDYKDTFGSRQYSSLSNFL